MRTIEELRKNYDGKLHIYCKDKETAERFLNDAEKEGFMFGTIKPTDSHTSDIFAVEDNHKVAHVSTVGRIAFQNGMSTRIDYDKYISGAENYMFEG